MAEMPLEKTNEKLPKSRLLKKPHLTFISSFTRCLYSSLSFKSRKPNFTTNQKARCRDVEISHPMKLMI